jgi:RNA polymerase sigma factor (sigma-70 family)
MNPMPHWWRAASVARRPHGGPWCSVTSAWSTRWAAVQGLDEHATADIFQTVFARLVEHLPRLREADKLQAWIVTTAKREVLGQWRRSQRTVSMTPGQRRRLGRRLRRGRRIADRRTGAGRPAAGAPLRRGLDRLDERCRELLLLVFRAEDEALPYDEVGRRLNMPTGSVGPTRARCLGKLRTLVN